MFNSSEDAHISNMSIFETMSIFREGDVTFPAGVAAQHGLC
jgi:hypothetical protein